MNREQLEKAITDLAIKSKAGQEVSNLADFIFANFEPKQPETERVTAKECFLACLNGHIANSAEDIVWPLEKMVAYSYEAAAAFNNYKPESHD